MRWVKVGAVVFALAVISLGLGFAIAAVGIAIERERIMPDPSLPHMPTVPGEGCRHLVNLALPFSAIIFSALLLFVLIAWLILRERRRRNV